MIDKIENIRDTLRDCQGQIHNAELWEEEQYNAMDEAYNNASEYIEQLEKENKILLEAVELIDCTSFNSWKGDCKCPNCKFLNKVKEIKGD